MARTASKRPSKRASTTPAPGARVVDMPVTKLDTWTYSMVENAIAMRRDATDLEVAFTRFDHVYANQKVEFRDETEGSALVRLIEASIEPRISEVLRIRMRQESARALAVLLIKHLTTSFKIPLEAILSDIAAENAVTPEP